MKVRHKAVRVRKRDLASTGHILSTRVRHDVKGKETTIAWLQTIVEKGFLLEVAWSCRTPISKDPIAYHTCVQ